MRILLYLDFSASNGITVATMSYDSQGRRVKKVAADGTHRYFYDGWLLVYEHIVRPNNTTNEIEYVWGRDVSGTRDGAAGIGGLLYQKRDGAIYVPHYDAYGNILGYRDAQGNAVASYTYDAFGNIIGQSGPMADSFVFCYSTKYLDAECGLYYYGYRFYHPPLMRWLTEDPIGEDGGCNLRLYSNNGGVYMLDALGTSPYVIGEQEPPRKVRLTAGTWNSMSAPFGTWTVQMRANLTVLGGDLASWPDAAAHLRHFLDNTGTPLEIRFKNMNNESASAKAHLKNEINDALRYAEMLENANEKQRFIMVTPAETSASNTGGNWLYAVGEYTTWARASVVRCGDSFSMNWHFYFRDIYDWAMGTGKRGGLVTDEEMALLHRYGKAKEFEMDGRHFIHFEWQKGQRMNSGVKVIGL